MMLLENLLTASTLVGLVFAAPTTPTRNNGSPCAAVSSAVAAQPGVATPTVGAELAYECINSVPLNKTAALNLIQAVKPYFRWQSTTSWLKDPPAEYVAKVQEPVDIFGELDVIEENVKSKWTKEYELHGKAWRPMHVCATNTRFYI
ncbi:hypothetical protein EJ05DRAFT_478748 [Pseudovirgaria hyperparasitica]|uniref:Uncharacterized protein n=1 Tax=Pseudovirgaria hyperparasitica TaxID=470096 RepID=A0A6A6VYQ0_9PEZI|nr:uncharacterized protein EJ05DRAFT_478748 [Pseudovirgaria hyperparasitica]KAF2755788.1 hypothetical protein EJ05DRAFT_478748 [Pseudovirgaria hyperparasitica]